MRSKLIAFSVGLVIAAGVFVMIASGAAQEAKPGGGCRDIAFAGLRPIELKGLTNLPDCLAIGDLNGDKLPDLAVGLSGKNLVDGRRPGQLILFFQKKGEFVMPPDREIALSVRPSGLVIGDFDRDGKNDIGVGQRGNRTLALYLGAEDFKNPHSNAYNNDSAGDGLAWGHLNRTGKTDFLSGVAWRHWDGGDKFQAAFISGPSGNDNFCSMLADLNNDGLDDIVFTTTNSQLRIYFGPLTAAKGVRAQDALYVVNLKTFMSGFPYWTVKFGVAVADLNDDSQMDVVAWRGKTADGPARLLIYYQNSPMGFTGGAGPSWTAEGLAGPVALGDFNGDGLCDIAACPAEGGSILLYLQKPWRLLKPALENADFRVILPKKAEKMTAGDLNGDGAADLVLILQDQSVVVFPALKSALGVP
ncbi:MAG: VCBS repeat-containing protein [Kiritimatiellae bacterium]|nr:VCBS repeat-containing protein [Kiritimatiellia bacterium]